MEDKGEVSDGYHTFNELYEHRHMLFRALGRAHKGYAWKSQTHEDGSYFKGWFIAGICIPGGMEVSYHIPMRLWDAFNDFKELVTAPFWDGHTSKDVIERLKEF